jgi:hypothetical protein
MARKANRGCGGRKISKVLAKEVTIDLEVASPSADCDVNLSEDEENCENLILCEVNWEDTYGGCL